MLGLTGAFSTLAINEAPDLARKSPQNSSDNNGGLSKNFNSLPNLVSSEKHLISKFSSLRNNYSSCDDEIEPSDQPIDFSIKYAETKKEPGPSTRNDNTKLDKNYNSFTMYAETDLDQPTDYSLRYAEDDSESEECNKITKTEFVNDTIKTYCTEDTPYETPFNFSTSTSMSDLRIDDKKLLSNEEQTKNSEEKPTSNSKMKSAFSSGIMSPDKPVNYCDEGTPGYFSRVDSCGSLNSIPVEAPANKPKEDNLQSNKNKEAPTTRRIKFPSETKVVKFEEVVNYAEETPLMFSRSSSLASLDSIEQHSIHDDRSSVVSDFSRLTSGVISPSELPDSPTQTVPPSPKPRKQPQQPPTNLSIRFAHIKKKQEIEQSTEIVNEKSTVFVDDIKKFEMESTPLEFSTATSLSSLLLEDCEEPPRETTSVIVEEAEKNTILKNEADLEINLDMNNELSGSEDEDDILAACINIGMQKNRYSQQTASETTAQPQEARSSPYSLPRSIQNTTLSQPTSALVPKKRDIASDSLRTYCTEDTPAILSQAGSNSDLSILSIGLISSNNNEKIDEDEDHDEDILDAQIDKTITSMECRNEKMLPHTNFLNLKTTEYNKSKIIESSSNPVASTSGYNHDSIRNYYTEDTPAILSHAGSESDLSALTMGNNEEGEGGRNCEDDDDEIKDYFSDLNSSSNDEDDEQLLNECVRFGMAKTTAATSNINNGMTKNCEKDIKIDNFLQISSNVASTNKQIVVDLNISLESNVSDEDNEANSCSSCVSSLSDESYESEQALLQECILAGMPKAPLSPERKESNELSMSEKTLLQQCILEGMKKCIVKPKKQIEDESNELTAAEKALLRQCILAGMPKNKNLTQGGPSALRESTELSPSERLLLQQCILAGMPKNKSTNRFNNNNQQAIRNGKQFVKSGKSRENQQQKIEHSCCEHCPRNQKNRQQQQLQGAGSSFGNRVKRKSRSYEKNSVRDNGRDFMYVSNQIMGKKKEFDRGQHEEWI